MATKKTLQFTPGPWGAKLSTDTRPVWSDPNGKPSGTHSEPMVMIHTGTEDEPKAIAYVWGFFGGKDTMKANAKLIAAAPDMLVALKRLLEESCPFVCDADSCECGENGNGLDEKGQPCEHIQACRAIAKAEGR